jgi:putative transcriptional regulator
MDNNLKAIRKRRRVSQNQLALYTGLSPRYVAFIESGERTPSLGNAFKISRALKTSIERIFLP